MALPYTRVRQTHRWMWAQTIVGPDGSSPRRNARRVTSKALVPLSSSTQQMPCYLFWKMPCNSFYLIFFTDANVIYFERCQYSNSRTGVILFGQFVCVSYHSSQDLSSLISFQNLTFPHPTHFYLSAINQTNTVHIIVFFTQCNKVILYLIFHG